MESTTVSLPTAAAYTVAVESELIALTTSSIVAPAATSISLPSIVRVVRGRGAFERERALPRVGELGDRDLVAADRGAPRWRRRDPVGSLELTAWEVLNSVGEPSSWASKVSFVRLLWSDCSCVRCPSRVTCSSVKRVIGARSTPSSAEMISLVFSPEERPLKLIGAPEVDELMTVTARLLY